MQYFIKCKDCFVYISEKVRKKKNFYNNPLINFTNELKKKSAAEIEEWLSDNAIKRNFFYKKNLYTKRCLIQQEKIENETVFIIRDIVKHDKEYEIICNFPDDWLKNNPLTVDEIEKIKNEICKEKSDKRLKKPPIPTEINEWLIPLKTELDLSIYESLHWISNLNKNFYEHKSEYYNLILNIVNNKINPENLEPFKLAVSENKFYILYNDIHYYNEQKKSYSIIYFLVNHYYAEKPTSDEIERILKECNIEGDLTKEKILPLVRRAYPDWVLADRDIWFDIEGLRANIVFNHRGAQNQNEYIDTANLALSGEEENILKNIGLPIFINGQAGSGKSTILYYLFANYCYKKLSMEKVNNTGFNSNINLLFLTYSEILSQETKRIVKDILRRNPNFKLENCNSSEISELLNKSILPFQDFLKKECLPNEKDEIYSIDRYLSFNLFKNLYSGKGNGKFICTSPEKKKYSPELVWHLIRTFIKGSKSESDLTPEEYNLIAKGDKSVEDGVYGVIYNDIYKKWYENKLSKYYWDDQDLVRDVLSLINNKKINLSKYAIIFCDEAQDFTKNEFELIAKLLIYNNYDLFSIKNIPLAFAGDPLQTLNPTGFNWDSVSAKFYEKIKLELKANDIEISRENLSKNYRSKPEIVKLANLIQFVRVSLLASKLIKKKEFKPQDPWNISNGDFKVYKFIIDKNISNAELEFAKNTPIIVPFDGEDPKSFIQNDIHLKNTSISENNTWTPIKSKGLEFSKVILYKFGDGENGKLFNELLNSYLNAKNINDDLFIKGSYFLNKLYVAITRAKNYLFIIDTKEGDENLWQYFTYNNPKNILEILNSEIINSIRKDFDYIHLASEDKKIELKDDNPEEIAQELYQKGKRAKDSELLHKAVYYFILANKLPEAKISEAEAYELENLWIEAGKIWEELEEYEKAEKCYWKSANWEAIINFFDNGLDTNSAAYKIANFMLASQKSKSLNRIIETFSDPSTVDYLNYNDKTSTDVIRNIKNILKNELNTTTNNTLEIASYLDRFLFRGFNKDLEFVELIGKYYLYGHNYNRAEKIFRENKINIPEYYWAKFFTSNSSLEKMKSLINIDFNQTFNNKMVEEYISDIIKKLDGNKNFEEFNMAALYYYKNQKYEKAVEIWEKIDNKNEFYFNSKYRLSKYNPDKIKWLTMYIRHIRGNQLGNDPKEDPLFEDLMELWESVKINQVELNELISKKEKSLILLILKSNNMLDDALILIRDCKLMDDIIEFVNILKNKKGSDDSLKFMFFKNLLNQDIREIKNYFTKKSYTYNQIIEYFNSVYDEEVNEMNKDNMNFKNWSFESLIDFTYVIENLFDNEDINKWKIVNLYKIILSRPEIDEYSKINIFERVSLAKNLIEKKLQETTKLNEQIKLKEYLKMITEINIPQELENIAFSENLLYDKITLEKPLKKLFSELLNILLISEGHENILIKKLNQLSQTDDLDLIQFDWPKIKEELLKKEVLKINSLIASIDKQILY